MNYISAYLKQLGKGNWLDGVQFDMEQVLTIIMNSILTN